MPKVNVLLSSATETVIPFKPINAPPLRFVTFSPISMLSMSAVEFSNVLSSTVVTLYPATVFAFESSSVSLLSSSKRTLKVAGIVTSLSLPTYSVIVIVFGSSPTTLNVQLSSSEAVNVMSSNEILVSSKLTFLVTQSYLVPAYEISIPSLAFLNAFTPIVVTVLGILYSVTLLGTARIVFWSLS